MRTKLFLALLSAVAAVAAVGACDPVHDDAIAALGGEAPGVRQGPLHRPGQPCGLCHDGALGDPPAFSVAGTIYVDEAATTAAKGAVVTLTDSKEQTYRATANEVGNFYVTPSEFLPAYPMKVSVTYDRVVVDMSSEVGRGGSCAACHVKPAGPTSAGPVFIPSDGGTP